jgi:hypothetical protein
MRKRQLLASRARGLVALLGAAMFVACNVGVYQGEDRPGDRDVEGPPPPADFHCERGERRREDTDHDGKPDRVVHILSNGDVLCSTEDRNADGRIDTWNLHEKGRIVEQATDSNFDGTLDRRVRLPNDGGIQPLIPPLAPIAPIAPRGDGGPA